MLFVSLLADVSLMRTALWRLGLHLVLTLLHSSGAHRLWTKLGPLTRLLPALHLSGSRSDMRFTRGRALPSVELPSGAVRPSAI